jgi:type II secretory pathway predicted ATPase ExeA
MRELFKWEFNPFSFRIIPELFVGHEAEINRIVGGVSNGSKYSLVLGPTGSGKTTMLKKLYNKFHEQGQFRHIFYLSKPPKDPVDWIMVTEGITSKGLLSFIFSGHRKGINLYNLSDEVNKKLDGSRCLMLIDECHEASLDSLEWLRALTDQIDNLYIILAGLPVFEKILKGNLETFMRRITMNVELTNLTKMETREMIKKRIEFYGGNDINPFTHNTLDFIYEQSGGFPREVLRLCDELTQKAIEKNISTIDLDFLKESDVSKGRVSLDTVSTLPDKQKMIIDVLSRGGDMTPNEIIDKLALEEYKDKENAVRSVNNLLRRLMHEKLVERKRIGKTYKYRLAGTVRTLMVQA